VVNVLTSEATAVCHPDSKASAYIMQITYSETGCNGCGYHKSTTIMLTSCCQVWLEYDKQSRSYV